MSVILRYNHKKRKVEEFDSEKVVNSGSQVFLGNNGWATGAESIGAGCHSSQVEDFRNRARDHGITGVDFKKDGTAVFSCRTARRDYMRMRGIFDKDAGYGDAAPNH